MGVETWKLLASLNADKELARVLCPVTIEDDASLLPVADWVDTVIEITLDSGCCEHVMDISDAPGYSAFITESSGSRRNQNFIVGNGQKVPNEGEIQLNMESLGTDYSWH